METNARPDNNAQFVLNTDLVYAARRFVEDQMKAEAKRQQRTGKPQWSPPIRPIVVTQNPAN